MGFKPIRKYFLAFKISNKKAYEILKERTCGISMKKYHNILAIMGFKPMTSITKHFLAYEISKEKALNIQALIGFKPSQNILQLLKHQKRKPIKYLRRKLMECKSTKPITFLL